MKEDALGGADLRRRVNGIVLPLRSEMDRGGAADGEASVLISEEIPKGEIEKVVG